MKRFSLKEPNSLAKQEPIGTKGKNKWDIIKGVEWMAVLSWISVFLIMLFTVINSFSRYILSWEIPGIYEIVQFLLVVTAFTALGWTQMRKRHIGMDFVTQRLSPKWRRLVGLIAIILTTAMLAIMVVALARGAYDATRLHEYIEGVIRLPKWVITWFLPLGSFGMLLVVLHELVKSIKGIFFGNSNQ